MAILQSGASTDIATVDPTFKTLRSTVLPYETIGSYTVSAASGSIAAATGAGGILYTFKYPGPYICVIRRISIGLQTTTAYAKNGIRFSGYLTRRNFTQGTTNGTLVTLTANNGKKRTFGNMPSTQALAYICTTAGITGDSAVGEDAQPFGSTLLDFPAVIGNEPFTGLSSVYNSTNSTYPIVLDTNEGFRIKNDTAFPATGVSTLIVQIEYNEIINY